MTVRLSRSGDLAVITLDRPDAMNALNASMIVALGRCIAEAASGRPRALIVTGAGGKAFCAGADIKEILDRPPGSQRDAMRAGQATFGTLDELPFPSLAVIDGLALGGGLELAMACTFRIASPASRLGLPELKLGLIPGYGGTQRLPRLVGEGRALEIIASGRLVGAEEAKGIGLVHEVFHIDDALAAGTRFIDRMGASFPAALALARRAVSESLSVPLQAGFELEADLFAEAAGTADAIEGMHAFLGKRKPAFAGR